MSLLDLQDVIVALTALGAAVIVARRVIGFAAAETSPKCASCASSACEPSPSPGASTTAATTPGAPAAHPLVFVRPSQR